MISTELLGLFLLFAGIIKASVIDRDATEMARAAMQISEEDREGMYQHAFQRQRQKTSWPYPNADDALQVTVVIENHSTYTLQLKQAIDHDFGKIDIKFKPAQVIAPGGRTQFISYSKQGGLNAPLICGAVVYRAIHRNGEPTC